MNYMKKLFTLIAFAASFSLAYAQPCTIDPTNNSFFAPRPDSLPCVERGIAYNQVIQIAVPASVNLQDFGAPFPFTLNVDSIVITNVLGLPAGITYEANPANGIIKGGQRGCATVLGTTNAPAGRYPIAFEGTFTASGQAFPPLFDGDTTIDFFEIQQLGGNAFELYLDVIEPGAPCRETSSVQDFSAELNAALFVAPNPSNGVFEIQLNTARQLTGTIQVTDINGRVVFAENIDLIGLYSKQINVSNQPKGLYHIVVKTPNGIATRKISVQ